MLIVKLLQRQGRTQNTGIRGGVESRRDNVSSASRKGESMRGGFPLSYWGSGGLSPGKFLGNRGAREAFLSLF